MASNEYINKNDLITPITPSSSDFANNLDNNPDSSNFEEPFYMHTTKPKNKILTKKRLWKYFIYFIVILVFLAISIFIIYTSTLILYEVPNLEICSKELSFYRYLIACIISAYLFSIGNFLSIFIFGCNRFALFSKLPACSKAFFIIFTLISSFYCFTLWFNYTGYEEVNKIYNKIYHGFEKWLYPILVIYIFILIGYLNDFKTKKKKNDD